MKKIFLFTFLCISLNFYSQFANNWYFGFNCGLNFSTTPTTILSNGTVPSYDNSSSISDVNGNLLFYSDGVKVWDKNNNQMPNGFGLIGDNTAGACALIIPIPCSNKKYVIFHVTNYSNPGYLSYTVVDMNLNAGLGDVIPAQKNISLGSGWTEKLCAYYNNLNNCYWLVSHKWLSDQFVSFKVDAGTIATTSVVSAIGSIHNCGTVGGTHDAMGQLTISQDGAKIVNALTCQDKFEIFDFNQNTGVITNLISLPGDGGNAWGTAFSPNSQKLYFTSIFGSSVYQYDISNYNYAAIVSSSVNIYNTNAGGYNFGYLELDPRGKIHVPRPNTNWHSIINNPNLTAAACNFSFTGQSTGAASSSWGCSRIAYNILGPGSFSLTANTANANCAFIGSATITAGLAGSYSYSWSPGNYSTAVVNNLAVGNYTVQVTNAACATNSITLSIYQTTLPSTSITASQQICNGQSATISSTVSGGMAPYTYSWSTGSTSPSITVSPTVLTNYFVVVTDANGCVFSAPTTVSVVTCDGIRQNVGDNAFLLYPNPSKGLLNLLGEMTFNEISVFNLMGQEIKLQRNSFPIDLSSISNGIYFIKIFNHGNLVHSQKLILKDQD